MTAVLVTVFCSLTSFAKPPTRATIYAAIYEGDNTLSFRNLKIAPINNNTFGVYQDEAIYNTCTYLRLYFRTDHETLFNFHLKLKRLTNTISDASTALNSLAIDVLKLSSSNSTLAYNHVQSQVAVSREVVDGFTYYEWTANFPTAYEDRNAFMVFIPFQTFVLGESPIYFEVLDLDINGEATVFSAGEQAIIQNLQDIKEIVGGDVGEVSHFDPSADITHSYTDASQAFQNDVDTFSGFINQYNMRTTSERVMFPALLTLSTAGGDLSIILGVCIAACSAGSLIFALRRLHG